MKPSETILSPRKRYLLVAFLCFLYAGFSIIVFLNQAYTDFWRTELLGPPRFSREIPDLNRLGPEDLNRIAQGNRFSRDPSVLFTSPASLSHLLGGIISLLAGITIWSLTHEKEIKKIKQETANNLLLPEERTVIEVLKQSGYELTQNKLAKETGLNKVQIHRTVSRLETKGILEKHKYGLTNKIILKKEIFE